MNANNHNGLSYPTASTPTNTPIPYNAPIPSTSIDHQQKSNESSVSQTEAQKQLMAQVLEKHPDAVDLYRNGEVEKWIETQPAQAKAWYNWALDQGGAQDVIKVFDNFKQATGKVAVAAPAAPAAPADETSRLSNDSNLSANKEFIKIMNKTAPGWKKIWRGQDPNFNKWLEHQNADNFYFWFKNIGAYKNHSDNELITIYATTFDTGAIAWIFKTYLNQ
jgi:hypothetical protein